MRDKYVGSLIQEEISRTNRRNQTLCRLSVHRLVHKTLFFTITFRPLLVRRRLREIDVCISYSHFLSCVFEFRSQKWRLNCWLGRTLSLRRSCWSQDLPEKLPPVCRAYAPVYPKVHIWFVTFSNEFRTPKNVEATSMVIIWRRFQKQDPKNWVEFLHLG